MRHGKRMGSAIAGVSMVAALASPTFGLNITFNAAESSVTYLHDAEDGDAGGVNPTNFRTQQVAGSQIPFGSAPGYQLGQGTVSQFGGAGTGTSVGKIGVGHVEDLRTATMTVQSLSFVNQNEVTTTNTSLKMDGNSRLQTDFSMVWDATGVYGPNLVGRISVPVQATIASVGGSARVQLTNVRWEVDKASDATGYFDARTPFTGEVAFTTVGTFSQNLTSNSLVLKNPDGTALTMGAGDKLRLSGTLNFLADGNSPADTQFQFGGLTTYQEAVLARNPLRYYRFEETSLGQQAVDLGSIGANGNYQGTIELQQQTASFSLGHGARFSGPDIDVDTNSASPSSHLSALVQSGNNGLNLHDLAFTAEAWVKREDSFGTAGFRTIIDNQTPSGQGWRLGMNDSEILFDGDTDLILPYLPGFALGEFYHIIAVDRGDGTAQIFVNGVSIGEGEFDLSSPGGGTFIIGSSGDGNLNGNLRLASAGTSQFVGIIDEVAIYGVPLTPFEATQGFDRGRENADLLPLMGVQIDPTFGFDIPEPGTVTLTMVGLAAAAMVRRRRVN